MPKLKTATIPTWTPTHIPAVAPNSYAAKFMANRGKGSIEILQRDVTPELPVEFWRGIYFFTANCVALMQRRMVQTCIEHNVADPIAKTIELIDKIGIALVPFDHPHMKESPISDVTSEPYQTLIRNVDLSAYPRYDAIYLGERSAPDMSAPDAPYQFVESDDQDWEAIANAKAIEMGWKQPAQIPTPKPIQAIVVCNFMVDLAVLFVSAIGFNPATRSTVTKARPKRVKVAEVVAVPVAEDAVHYVPILQDFRAICGARWKPVEGKTLIGSHGGNYREKLRRNTPRGYVQSPIVLAIAAALNVIPHAICKETPDGLLVHPAVSQAWATAYADAKPQQFT